jgi:hypothetical protein
MSILLKHISEPPPPIPGLSPRLQRVLDKALAKNREVRFQKAIDFAKAFDSIVRSETEQSTFMGITPVEEPLSTITVAEPVDSLIVVQSPKTPLRKWIPFGLAAIGVLASAIFLINGYALSSTVTTPTAPTLLPTATHTQQISLPPGNLLGPPVVVHFQDEDAVLDQVAVEASAMLAPPAGSHYEVWLIGPEARASLGILELDDTGQGTLVFNAAQNENLLGLYDQAQITLIPNSPVTPTDTNTVAYAYTLPSDGLAYVRVLLVSFPDTPDKAPLIQGLTADTRLLEQSARDLSNAFANGDEPSTKKHAEVILNILVGNQSSDHKDWNGDGTTSDPGTSYGFLLNGSNLGHIRAIYTHAEYASNAPRASQNMILHGGEVKLCSENLAQWAAALKSELLKIFAAQALTDMEEPVRNAVALAEQISSGADLDEDEQIEARAGECGVTTIYTSAYAMAAMPLLPVNVGTATAVTSGTPSPGGTLISGTTSPSAGGGGGSGVTAEPPAATQHIPPGQQRTREPKPTNPGGGGGNSGGNNGGGNSGGNSNNP